MALKDKLMTLEDFKAVRDVDVASNQTQFTAIKADLDDVNESLDALEPGLSSDAKIALLACFAHVAWDNENGQTYYDALESALNPETGLVSISAVFNPGTDVIYDTTPLNDLKAYLTVTGAYNNGTSKTIRDYTLSGTLSVGSNTITVSREGKSTTFSVTAVYHWDVDWNYTQGNPEDNGLSIAKSQGSSSMEADGFVIESENATDKTYEYLCSPSDADAEFNNVIVEWKFVLLGWGSYNNAPYMNGIYIAPAFGNRGGNILNNPSFVLNRSGVTVLHPISGESQYNHDVLAEYNFEVDTEYTVRMETNTTNCKVYINGTLIATDTADKYANMYRSTAISVRRGASIKMKSFKERWEV